MTHPSHYHAPTNIENKQLSMVRAWQLMTSPKANWSQESANLDSNQWDRLEMLVGAALPYKKILTKSEFAIHKKHCLMWIMPRTKETSEGLRLRIVDLHKAGKDYKSISKSLDVHQSTVRQNVYEWRKFSTVAPLARPSCKDDCKNTAQNAQWG